jgi:hypothetical protein
MKNAPGTVLSARSEKSEEVGRGLGSMRGDAVDDSSGLIARALFGVDSTDRVNGTLE